MFLHFSSILFSSLISLIFSIKSFVRVFSLFSKSLFVSNFFRAEHFCQKGAKVEGKTLDQTVVSPPPLPFSRSFFPFGFDFRSKSEATRNAGCSINIATLWHGHDTYLSIFPLFHLFTPSFLFREIVKVTGSRTGVVRVNELIPR